MTHFRNQLLRKYPLSIETFSKNLGHRAVRTTQIYTANTIAKMKLSLTKEDQKNFKKDSTEDSTNKPLKEYPLSIKTVLKVLGHGSIKSTQIYRMNTIVKIEKDLQKLSALSC